jgi:hypothetical protein
VPMPISLYQKDVINDVRNFVSSNNHLIGLLEGKKTTVRKRYRTVDLQEEGGTEHLQDSRSPGRGSD